MKYTTCFVLYSGVADSALKSLEDWTVSINVSRLSVWSVPTAFISVDGMDSIVVMVGGRCYTMGVMQSVLHRHWQ